MITETKMPQATLGQGGPIVSRLAVGTMTFGAETDEKGAFAQLDLFASRGGTFIDTADVYSAGASEQMIGKWGKARGGLDDMVIATKGRFSPPKGSYGASRRGLTRALEGSLKRLGQEAIDVYFVHGWDRHTPILDTLATLTDLVKAGKIHNIAWSNVSGWQLQKIVSTAQAERFAMPVAMQPQFNLLERGIEAEVLPCCLENNISLTPWSPLGGGWLTGKYSAANRPSGATRLGEDPNRGVEAYDIRNTDRTYRILDVVEKIATRHAHPMTHVALAWLLARPGVSSVLLGARDIDQLQGSMDAYDFTLERGEMAALSLASSNGPLHYPYNFLEDWCDIDVWKRLQG